MHAFQPIPAAGGMVNRLKASQGGWFAGKIGTTELLALEYAHRWVRPPFPKEASWRRPAHRLLVDSGVFPPEQWQFEEFIQIYLNAVQAIGGLYLWQKDSFLKEFEQAVAIRYARQALSITAEDVCYRILRQLTDLRWLVVSPFVKTMRQQLLKLPQIHGKTSGEVDFRNTTRTCRFLACPLFSYLVPPTFANWTEGLKVLTEKAMAETFDIALVGAGAWSLPLLANLKSGGKKGLHLGGEIQLAFGIKGRRWDGKGLYNEHWVRPSPDETPPNFMKKENGCYW